MKVAALIPTYNRGTHVRRAIDSALGQTHPVDEVIVIDDGSTDGTAQMLESAYGTQVRVVRQENTGVSGARRRAIRETQCEWIAFLDSDDEWTVDRNRNLVEAANLVPGNVAWIFGDVSVIRDRKSPASLFKEHGLRISGKMQTFDDTWSVHHPFQFGLLQASIIRREALQEIDCFSEGLRHSEDFLAGVQVACHHRFAAISAEVTKLYRTSDLSASSADLAGRGSADYYRARVSAYALIAETDSRIQWRESHAHAVRGLCKVLASRGEPFRALAVKQFDLVFSTKSVVFLAAALFGRTGLRVWDTVGSALNRDRDDEENSHTL